MNRQSPDFLPWLLSLTRGTDCSSTMKLRGDDAKATLGALDEVVCSFAVAMEWSDTNLCYTILQLFGDGKISNKYERGTLSVMGALVHESCQVPRHLVDPNALAVDDGLIVGGGFAVIRKGTLGGKAVAVRILKPCPQTDSRNSVPKVHATPKYLFEGCQLLP